MSGIYFTPDKSVQVFPIREEYTEKKSRFIASLFAVDTRCEAEQFLEEIRRLYPDANHHCFAWVIGDPGNPRQSQCSDDGEPSGTAGRPILGVLAGGSRAGGYGNTLIVVSRYFGGIKLGSGGLVRAYSAAARAVLEQAVYIEYVDRTGLSIRFAYPFEREIRYICAQMGGDIVSQEYLQEVCFTLEIQTQKVEELCSRLLSCTAGSIVIKR